MELHTVGQSFLLQWFEICLTMNNPGPVKPHRWADGPYPLIETPKHKEGKVIFSAKVAECYN